MANSSNYPFPLITDGQSNGFATHNDMVHRMDSMVHLAIEDRDELDSEGAGPLVAVNGQSWLIDGVGLNDWNGKDNNIALWVNGWIFIPIQEGMLLWVKDESNVLLAYDGAAWVQIAAGGGAPTAAQYVTLVSDGTLSAERVLTGTASQIEIIDGTTIVTLRLPTTGATVVVAIPGTGAFRLPSGASGVVDTPVNGDVRFNTTTGQNEIYEAGAWHAIVGTAAKGGGNSLTRHKTADQVITTQLGNFTNDDTLVFPMAVNENWIGEIIAWITATSVGAPNMDIVVPAGITDIRYSSWHGDPDLTENNENSASPTVVGFSWPTNGLRMVRIPFSIRNGGTAGDFQVRWTRDVANPTMTVHDGSYLTALKTN